jgi:hypothetical protein
MIARIKFIEREKEETKQIVQLLLRKPPVGLLGRSRRGNYARARGGTMNI